MTKFLRVSLFITLLISTHLVFCETYNGNTLYSDLTDGSDWKEERAKLYIMGVVDSMMYYEPKSICEVGVSYHQIIDSIKKELKRLPEKRHLSAFSFISVYAARHFNCYGTQTINNE